MPLWGVWLLMFERLKIKGTWYFYYDDGTVIKAENDISPDGLNAIAGGIEAFSSPYLALGNDTATGWTMNEVFRKAVSNISRTANEVRFRTQLLSTEAMGDFEKAAIYINASSSTGSGTMFNLLRKTFSKANGTILTIECRITVQDG